MPTDNWTEESLQDLLDEYPGKRAAVEAMMDDRGLVGLDIHLTDGSCPSYCEMVGPFCICPRD